jgi:hypothetical protein
VVFPGTTKSAISTSAPCEIFSGFSGFVRASAAKASDPPTEHNNNEATNARNDFMSN